MTSPLRLLKSSGSASPAPTLRTNKVLLSASLASKKVAIELYAALSDKKWPEALAMMSQETRNFLEDSSNGKGALGALEAGELAFAGQVARFRPAADFFIADLAGIKDALPNAPAENETKLRKELYAINSDGQARDLFIYEADAWRFHSSNT